MSTLIWSLPLVFSQLAGVMDLPIHYQWAAQFERALQEGIWVPRWNAASNQGLGDATFMHIHPLFYYLVATVNSLVHDLWLAMRLVLMASHLALGVAVYGLAWRLWGGRRSALGCALAAQWAPYFLLMVVYGQAFPTLVALPFLAVLLGVVATGKVSLRLFVVGSLALVGTVLSHVLVAFTGIVCISLAMGMVLVIDMGQRAASPSSRSALLQWLVVVAAALGLSAWYLVPAVLGRAWINPQAWVLGDASSPVLAWAHNAIYPLGAALRGEPSNLVLLWLLPLPATAISLLATHRIWGLWRAKAWPLGDTANRAALAGLFMSVAALFFASGASAWLWSQWGLLQQLQFPWRFLGVLSLAAALLLGHAVFWPAAPRTMWGAGGALVVLTVAISAYLLAITALQGVRVVPPSAWLTGQFGQPEYLPAAVPGDWLQTAVHASACGNAPADRAAQSALVKCDTLQNDSHAKRFMLQAAQPTSLVLPVFFHPGWSLQIDGQAWAAAVDSATGLIRLDVAAGTHEARLLWSGTVLDRWGKGVSALSAVACLVGLLVWYRRRRQVMVA